MPELQAPAARSEAMQAFLRGLIWHEGGFFENTGRLGQRTVRRVEWPTGRMLRRVDFPADVFRERLVHVGNRLVQLTWRSGRGFVYALIFELRVC